MDRKWLRARNKIEKKKKKNSCPKLFKCFEPVINVFSVYNQKYNAI